jgi:hypothetical protein
MSPVLSSSVVVTGAITALAQAIPAVTDPGTAGWIQAGSLLAFAGAVLWELRQQRIERRESEHTTRALLNTISMRLAVLLERKRNATPGSEYPASDDESGGTPP